MGFRLPLLFLLPALLSAEIIPGDVFDDGGTGFGGTRLMVTLSGGFAYRTGSAPDSIPDEMKGYISALRRGTVIAAQGAYFFLPLLGAGLTFSCFSGNHSSSEDVVAADYATGRILGKGPISDDISILAFGPVAAARLMFLGANTFLFFSLSPVMIFYSDRSVLLGRAYEIKGRTFGLESTFGLDYLFSRHFGAGFGLSYQAGSVSDLQLDGQEGLIPGAERMNRIGIFLGLKFNY